MEHSENELDELENDEGAGALVRAGVALLKQDVPSAGVRAIMTSCFWGGASTCRKRPTPPDVGLGLLSRWILEPCVCCACVCCACVCNGRANQ